jgi:voltage-gated potassium channel
LAPRWEAWMERAVATRRIFPYLVLLTAVLAVFAGFLVTVVDRKDFPDFGTGVWWAIVTLATVGYGDVVPHTAWGKVVASCVIVVGVTLLTFVIAIVTSYFVSAADRGRPGVQEPDAIAFHDALDEIKERLAAIEQKLGD